MAWNHTRTVAVFIALLGLLPTAAASRANAAAAPEKAKGNSASPTASVPVTSSDSNYLGDELKWDRPIPARSTEALGSGAAPDYCLPANTTVIGRSSKLTSVATQGSAEAAKTTNAAGNEYLSVTLMPGGNPTTRTAACPGIDPGNSLAPGQMIYITADDLKAAGARTDEKQAGAMMTPDTTHDGNYLGDRLSWEHPLKAYSYAAIQADSDADICLPPRTTVVGRKSSFDIVEVQAVTVIGKRQIDVIERYLAVTLDPHRKPPAGPAVCPGLDNPKMPQIEDQFFVKADDLRYANDEWWWFWN